jgi:hypothetical protein
MWKTFTPSRPLKKNKPEKLCRIFILKAARGGRVIPYRPEKVWWSSYPARQQIRESRLTKTVQFPLHLTLGAFATSSLNKKVWGYREQGRGKKNVKTSSIQYTLLFSIQSKAM